MPVRCGACLACRDTPLRVVDGRAGMVMIACCARGARCSVRGGSCCAAACRGCGEGLAGEPAVAQRRHQVTDIEPAPAPRVTEYVVQAKECPCCGTVTEGDLPAHVRARASFGPEASAQAANLTVGHHIP